MNYYALTMRKTVSIDNNDLAKAQKLLNRYKGMINYMMSTYCTIDINYSYEILDKPNGKVNLHLHAMIMTDTPYELLSIPRQKGMIIQLDEVKSQLAWEIYIKKDPYTESDVIKYFNYQQRGHRPRISDLQNDILSYKLSRIRIV